MRGTLPVLAGVVLLAGCVQPTPPLTLPVSGALLGASETFSGYATGYAGGYGDITVLTSTGVTCSGRFVYTSSRRGNGVFRCDDGRSGPFTFSSIGFQGIGEGTLGRGQYFTFTFG